MHHSPAAMTGAATAALHVGMSPSPGVTALQCAEPAGLPAACERAVCAGCMRVQVPLLLKDIHIEMRTLGAKLLAVFTRVQSPVDSKLESIQAHVPQVRGLCTSATPAQQTPVTVGPTALQHSVRATAAHTQQQGEQVGCACYRQKAAECVMSLWTTAGVSRGSRGAAV